MAEPAPAAMDRPLALALYLAAARTAAAPAPALPEPPAAAPRIWLHAPEAGTGLRAMAALAARLAAARPRLGLILTHPEGSPPPPGLVPAGTLLHPALPDDPAAARAAFGRWSPDLLVLGDGPLSPALVEAAAEAGHHAFLVGARRPQVAARWRSLPGLQRALLRRLRRILVPDAAALRAFGRAGARPWRLELGGPLALSPGPLPHNGAERAALAGRIGARPVWLAVAVPAREEAVVLAAQQAAQGLAHRLLLILVPADPGRGPALAATASAMGLSCARRSADDEPEDDHQVYVADTEGELGLWYRLAPVTFIGGTLTAPVATDAEALSDRRPRDPIEAAALGSAVVCGPVTDPHDDSHARLSRAGACWTVPGQADTADIAAPEAARRGPGARLRAALMRRARPMAAAPAPAPVEPAATALADAVIALLAPDRAAGLARAGWEVATEGAEGTERIVDLVLAALDGRDA